MTMATKILPFLYLGDDVDAKIASDEKGWKILNVLETPEGFPVDKLPDEIVIPILDNYYQGSSGSKWRLNWNKVMEATEWIERTHKENPNAKILVHCGAGQERSPLVVQYYLVRYHNLSADQAFAIIKTLRPEVFRCDQDYQW
jgi:protein-tyrosine phosphatase